MRYPPASQPRSWRSSTRCFSNTPRGRPSTCSRPRRCTTQRPARQLRSSPTRGKGGLPRAGAPPPKSKLDVALFRQPGGPQRIAKSCRERRGAVHARKLAAVAKGRVKFEHPRSRDPRFFHPSEFGERGGQLHIGDAVGGIGLNGLVGGATGFVIAAAQQMTHRLRIECSESPCVERAEPHAALAPLDRPLCFSAPSENDAAKDVGQRR